jgi:hypothetical protein
MARKGVTVSDPSIQREIFGQWVIDASALVFRFNKATNSYQSLPSPNGAWSYVVGVDLGFDDSDAIAVIGWNPAVPGAYLVEEIVTDKQGITPLANQIQKVIDTYNPDKIVADTGGLGKKIVEELQTRFSLPIVAADKARKWECIELLNDAMRTEQFFAKADSRFASDCMMVEWDRDAMKSAGGEKYKISDRFHSDVVDAVIYAWKEAFQWLYVETEEKPKPNTPEWYKNVESEMEQGLLDRFNSSKQDDWLA